jgi:hypothetical protein|tara:strand:- start:16 stop:420 length:405 start_codon:yes stop_codon:yes gene_type:complete
VEQFQILVMDALTVDTKQFAIPTGDPGPCRGKAKISNLALGPTVDSRSLLTALLTNGLKALIGLRLYMGSGRIGRNRLADNSYSTKGEIGCYTGYGHRRPPLDLVYLDRQTYIHGDTGCPFYLISQHFPSVFFN